MLIYRQKMAELVVVQWSDGLFIFNISIHSVRNLNLSEIAQKIAFLFFPNFISESQNFET